MLLSYQQNRSSRVCGLLISLAIWVIFLGAPVMSAFAQTDLLQIPAKKSELAVKSKFYDVATAGTRIVAVGERGHIMYSDDNGVSWSQADVPMRVSLTAVCFPTAEKGWAVGHDAVVLHTVDGGKTWVKQLDGFEVNKLELTLYQELVKNKEIELAQADETLKEDLTFELEELQYKVEDFEIDSKDGPWKPLLDLWFDADGHGIVIGVFGTILSTDDGGQTWQSISDHISNPDGFHYKNITQAGSVLIIGGEIGNLYRSMDNGLSWEQLDSPSEASYFGMISNDSGDIVIGTSFKGGIVYSRDQGASWALAQAKTGATLADGTSLADGSLVVVSYAGQVFKVTGNGEDISIQNIAQAKFPGMTSASATQDGQLVVVGQKGLMRIPLK
jgi:photosystem II stability/assembly factor-like uncharacterized protein